jgi:hypothetical protein
MTNTSAFFVAAVLCAGSAWAGRVPGSQPPAPEAVRQAVAPAAAASHADDSSSMREGVINAVAPDQVEINGTWLKLAEGKTRVFRNGQAVKARELAKGQKVKFTLAAGDGAHATLGAVYVP